MTLRRRVGSCKESREELVVMLGISARPIEGTGRGGGVLTSLQQCIGGSSLARYGQR